MNRLKWVYLNEHQITVSVSMQHKVKNIVDGCKYVK